jgi:hypothetical protein
MMRAALLAAAITCLPAISFAQEGALPSERDAEAIERVITSMLHAIDARNWSAVRAAFAKEVYVDYTSLNGGNPGPQAADDLVGGWQAMLPGFEATQHLTGPMVVTVQGDDAMTIMAVIATHRMDGLDPSTVWQVGGHYRIGLAGTPTGWLIDGITLDTAYVTGDTGLPEKAQARASGGNGQ